MLLLPRLHRLVGKGSGYYMETGAWCRLLSEYSGRADRVDCFYRFIPNREGVDLQASYSLLHADGSPSTPTKPKKRTPHGELHFQKSMFYKFGWLKIIGDANLLIFHSRRSKSHFLYTPTIRTLSQRDSPSYSVIINNPQLRHS